MKNTTEKKNNLEKYLHVTNAQDLIDLGVIPKSSSESLAVITKNRLMSIFDTIKPGINQEMLGTWESLVDVVETPLTGKTNPSMDTPEGQKVLIIENYNGKQVKGLEGFVANEEARGSNQLGVLINNYTSGTNLGGYYPGQTNGEFIHTTYLQLLDKTTSYKLRDGVVADATQGHLVKIVKEFELSQRDSNNNKVLGTLRAGLTGKITGYDARKNAVAIQLPKKVKFKYVNGNSGDQELKDVMIKLDSPAIANFRVSSLGPVVPLDMETEMYKEVIRRFFPRTALTIEDGEKVILAMMIGKDDIFYGPPGSGKSSLANDIIDIAKLQEVIFKVDGCKIQCNPASLYDENFAKINDACPECKIKYDKNDTFKKTGFFKRPKPSEIAVTVAKYDYGQGIEKVDATASMDRMQLAGFKLPDFNKDKSKVNLNDQFDPEGFNPGSLLRTNNGILKIEEFDSLRTDVQTTLHSALNESQLKPDDLRYVYPANALVIGTANNITKVTGPVNDRVFCFAIDYSQDVDTGHRITRRVYHKYIDEMITYPIEDVHLMEPLAASNNIPMPEPIERAIVSTYIQFRNEYAGKGKRDETASGRSQLDALEVSRAKLRLDQMFFASTPHIADETYAVYGINFAFTSRVSELTTKLETEAAGEISKWVTANFPVKLREEENTWWCRVYKDIATAKTQVEGIDNNFKAELMMYKEDMKSAENIYDLVQSAYTAPTKANQVNKIKYPFMDLLFRQEPHFDKIKKPQLTELVSYYLKSQEGVACKI